MSEESRTSHLKPRMTRAEWQAWRATRPIEQWILSASSQEIRCPGWYRNDRRPTQRPSAADRRATLRLRPCGHDLGRVGARTAVMVRWKQPGQELAPAAGVVAVSMIRMPGKPNKQPPATSIVAKCPDKSCNCQVEFVFLPEVDADAATGARSQSPPAEQGRESGGSAGEETANDAPE